jgi:uncharacterized membrane protein YphA (DoxX/SURF4 family)
MSAPQNEVGTAEQAGMTPQSSAAKSAGLGLLPLLARVVLGCLFIYMGLHKAMHPVEFLKLVRQYEILHSPVLLNIVASTLPWFETFCGVMLLLGLWVRGTALMLLGMLIPFTVVVFLRAMAVYHADGGAFCAIKFDCGCGAGEVIICRKLIENAVLAALSTGLIFWRGDRLCLRHSLSESPPPNTT